MFKKLIVIFLVALTISESKQDTQRNNLLNGKFCQGCRSITSFVSNFNSSAHRDEYTEVFQNFCELYYPPSTDYQAGPCPVFVQALFQVLDKIDPVHHCDQIGACTISASSKIYNNGQKLDKNEMGIPRDDNFDDSRQSIICEACETVVSQLRQQLLDPEFVNELRSQVNSLCDYLKVLDQDKLCRSSLMKYLNQTIEFIKELNPHQYCQSINVCSRESPVISSGASSMLPQLTDFANFGIETSVKVDDDVVKSIDQDQKGSSKFSHGPNCALCKTIVKEMFKYIKANKTEENIRNGLDKVCDWVFSDKDRRADCKEYVEAYSRELVQLLVDETDPEMICMLLDQCLASRDFYKLVDEKAPVSRPADESSKTKRENVTLGELITMLDPSVPVHSMRGCIECKLFIKYLQDTLENPKSLEQTKTWLIQNLCDSLPTKDLLDSCESLVDNYAETFFKAVAENLEPERICLELQACKQNHLKSTMVLDNMVRFHQPIIPSLTNKKDDEPAVSPFANLRGGRFCDQCVDTITKIDEYLSSHPVDHDVKVIIDQVCNKLPTEIGKNECTIIITNFGQEIVKGISSMESPSELCSQIHLC